MRALSREEHGISRKQISRGALDVLYELQRAGFEAYLVGGGVRDLLLGGQPKDFDVATDATPEQIKQLFRRSRIVGRRFQIVHVRFGREIIEVTTFRAHHVGDTDSQQSQTNEQGMLLRDNVFGDLREDALRRDFTVNALYYSVDGFKVLDHVDGYDDLKQRRLRIIGKPEQRYREDPVRMLRALRFTCRLQFDMETETETAIASCAEHLAQVSAPRLFDETVKLLLCGNGATLFLLLQKHGLFEVMFPDIADILGDGSDESAQLQKLIEYALQNTDDRLQREQPVTPAFLFAALLWPLVKQQARIEERNGANRYQALQLAGYSALDQQMELISIPKRFSIPMREIWTLQHRLEKTRNHKAAALAQHRRFRAAYDFLLLREKSGESLHDSGEWWTRYQEENPADSGESKRKPRRRRRRRRNNSGESDQRDGD